MARNDDDSTSDAKFVVGARGRLNETTCEATDSTEVCRGPRLCRTGKTGLVRSSSSFQVTFLSYSSWHYCFND